MKKRERSGYMLLELMITLALMGLFLNLATTLIARVWRAQQQSLNADRASKSLQQMTTSLRRDLDAAATITVFPGERTLRLPGSIVWHAGPNTINRKTADDERTWEVPGVNITFEPSPAGLVLVMRQTDGNTSRVPMLNQTLWAGKALNR